MEPLLEEEEEHQLDRIDSLPDTDLASTSSSLSFILTTEDSRSTSSSGDISTSSGEIPVILVEEAVIPRLVDPVLSNNELTAMVTARPKCVGRNNQGLNWGFASVIGRRREMEDAIAVRPAFMSRTCDHVGGCTAPGSRTSAEISPVHFFGVYDGHGGSQVAKFCAERMHEVIAEEWDREAFDGCGWQKKWEMAFSSGFKRTDNEVLTEAIAPEMVGSTAVVTVLSGCQIITSNCGDSRAVLCRGTETIPLTVDQKPDRHDELLRIEGEGGKVINWNGARVFGVLAMSRAIGDWYLRPWIIPAPEITFVTRSDEDECLILASDGLWDVMTNEEVGEVARRMLRRRRRMINEEVSPAQAVADNLKDIAYGKNSSDNISIIVVDLKPRRRRQKRH
ncbi:probable protein phosphatase 2C 6 [Pistacia vera]|uniref:probable protein phosphatase 2C 6 n=1 Tax=Pistacia vera TaxID=55513 RepID=UPI0012639980|nr:probable protein phosphatase 2C 6 [Pistacia vera]